MIALHSRPRGANISATVMRTTSSHRTWSTMDLARQETCHAFLVGTGAARVIRPDGSSLEVAGPALVWFARSVRGRFQLRAGGHGWHFSVNAEFVMQVVGAMAVGIQLRPVLETSLMLPAEKIGTRLDELSVSFAALAREAEEHNPGGQEMIAAHLTQILIHMWRASANLGAGSAPRSSNLPTAQRFQQLLELHYHELLRVGDYADMLGVTRAHLHDTCLRMLGRTPLSVIHARITEQARQRLRYTTLPIEQIAYSLGFRDPAYFNRFFKRLTGETPGAFRQRTKADKQAASSSFAAWP